MQDENEAVFVDREQGELVEAVSTPQYKSSKGFENRETCVANGSRRGVRVQEEGTACGELPGGFRDCPFLHEVLEETQRGIPPVEDLGKQQMQA